MKPAPAGATLVCVIVAACGSTVEPPVTSVKDATLILYVSNQSFEDDSVGITVEINDELIIDDGFSVEDQHNWIEYPLALAAGDYLLRATSTTGASADHEFTLPTNETRWAVLEYWYYPDDTPRGFTFRVDDEQVGFD